MIFGRHFEEKKYWQAIADSSLMEDLEILPDGDLTEVWHCIYGFCIVVTDLAQIGEKGISKYVSRRM